MVAGPDTKIAGLAFPHALLTPREFARYLVEQRQAHYHFTVKANQPELLADLAFYFHNDRQAADFIRTGTGKHGRIETRKIWVTSELNTYLIFSYVQKAFMIEREAIEKETGKLSQEVAYGITSKPTDQADPQQVLGDNRGHWRVESKSCHYIID